MKTICIFHRNCFDGICAAWVVKRRFPTASEFRAFSYDMEFPFNEYGKEDKIIIVDFSFKRDVMLAIKEQCESLLVLDHHKTAQAACEGLDFCKFDMSESGASLAWKYFFPNAPVPNLVRYVADRDLWKFELSNSEAINAFIQSWPMTIQSYEMLYHNLEATTGMMEAVLSGQAIERYKKTMVEAICYNAILRDVGGYQVPTINATLLFSEIGHELCKLHPDKPFAASFFIRNDNKKQWSLRSIGDFDVSAVAKQFGGGGHRNSAGFEQKLSDI